MSMLSKFKIFIKVCVLSTVLLCYSLHYCVTICVIILQLNIITILQLNSVTILYYTMLLFCNLCYYGRETFDDGNLVVEMRVTTIQTSFF